MLTKIKAVYRVTVDHLTKVLGGLGAALMSYLSWVDPEQVRNAAQIYLGQHAYLKIAAALFGLVMLRGYYTGKKAAALQRPAAPPPP